MYDGKINEICLKILEEMDSLAYNETFHSDFVFELEYPVILVELAVNKLVDQGYIKKLQDEDSDNPRHFRLYAATYTGDTKDLDPEPE